MPISPGSIPARPQEAKAAARVWAPAAASPLRGVKALADWTPHSAVDLYRRAVFGQAPSLCGGLIRVDGGLLGIGG
jgi:hypothetical protein